MGNHYWRTGRREARQHGMDGASVVSPIVPDLLEWLASVASGKTGDEWKGLKMITYKVGYVFSLASALKTALGDNAGKVAQFVEAHVNNALESAQVIVPKAGTKAAAKEAVSIRGVKSGSVAVVAGVRYSVAGIESAVQRAIDFNAAIKELESGFESEVAVSVPDWLAVAVERWLTPAK